MKLSKLAKSRLNTLIRYMEKLPASANKHFYMGNWFGHQSEGHAHLKKGETVTREHLQHCGTQACALGWAATIPAFNKAGLEIRMDDERTGWPYLDGKKYTHNRGLIAAQKFFDIAPAQASALFGFDLFIRTPKQWAKSARKEMKEWSRG